MVVPKNYRLTDTAKQLRRDMTPEERKLWYLFLRKYPIKIYKQRIIDNFIVDFYCASAKLVIEIDGSQHYTEDGEAHDAERSNFIKSHDLMVLRFSNYDVNNHFSSVCEEINKVIEQRRK